MSVFILHVIIGFLLMWSALYLENWRHGIAHGVFILTLAFLIAEIGLEITGLYDLQIILNWLNSTDVRLGLLGVLVGLISAFLSIIFWAEISKDLKDHPRHIIYMISGVLLVALMVPPLLSQFHRITGFKTPVLEASFASIKPAQIDFLRTQRQKSATMALAGAAYLSNILKQDAQHVYYQKTLSSTDKPFPISEGISRFEDNKKRKEKGRNVIWTYVEFPGKYKNIGAFIQYYIETVSLCAEQARRKLRDINVIKDFLRGLSSDLWTLSRLAMKTGEKLDKLEQKFIDTAVMDVKRESHKAWKDLASLAIEENGEHDLGCFRPPEEFEEFPTVDMTPDDLEYPHLHLAAAYLLRFTGNEFAALFILENAVKLFPKDLNVQYSYANILYENSRNFLDSYRAFNKIIQLVREHEDFVNQGLKKRGLKKRVKDDLEGLRDRYNRASVVTRQLAADVITAAITDGDRSARRLARRAVRLSGEALDIAEKNDVGLTDARRKSLEATHLFARVLNQAIRPEPDYEEIREIKQQFLGFEGEIEIDLRDQLSRHGHGHSTTLLLREYLDSFRSRIQQIDAILASQ